MESSKIKKIIISDSESHRYLSTCVCFRLLNVFAFVIIFLMFRGSRWEVFC